jgi:carboxypeptidase family protein
MVDHYSFAASPKLCLLVLLPLIIVPGCRSSSPVAPDAALPTISGHVYQTPTRDAGEPPLVDVLITIRKATGQETTALTNRGGFYSVGAAMGSVLVTASKEGYETRQSRFDVTESTVLNFGLTPNVSGTENDGN